MALIFSCTHCGRDVRTEAESGSQIECPHCRAPLNVPSAPLPAGMVIGGFRLEELIDQGGMGDVYLATQISMDRKVAIKVLQAPMTQDSESIRQFLQEVRMLARLEHPNIVTAFEAGEDGGVYFLAMQYVEGSNLARRLREKGPLSEAEAMRIAGKVAKALQYAWEQHHVLHEDIKPGNVMIDRNGEPRILDLGIARHIHDRSRSTDEITGTPEYMSPEKAAGLAYDQRSDMYSLGCMLYELLLGQPPFQGTPEEVLASQISATPVPPRMLKPKISIEAEQVILALLAKKPEQRFADWSRVTRVLHRWERPDVARALAAEASDAPSLMVPQPDAAEPESVLTGTVERRRHAVLFFNLVVTAIIITTVAIWFHMDRQRKQAAIAEQKRKEEAARVEQQRKELSKVLEQRFAAATTYAERNITNYVEAIRRFQEIETTATEGGVAEWRDKSRSEIQRLRTRQEIAERAMAEVHQPLPEGSKLDQVRTRLERAIQAINAMNPHAFVSHNVSEEGVSVDLSNNPDLSDLSPLQGLPIHELKLDNTSVVDISPLRGMPLRRLSLAGCEVVDLEPLRGAPMADLNLMGNPVESLWPLEGMPLLRLNLSKCDTVTDIHPLENMPLQELWLDQCKRLIQLAPLKTLTRLEQLTLPPESKDIGFLRELISLKRMGFSRANLQTREEFWQAYDARPRSFP